jgi:hypothetical protein
VRLVERRVLVRLSDTFASAFRCAADGEDARASWPRALEDDSFSLLSDTMPAMPEFAQRHLLALIDAGQADALRLDDEATHETVQLQVHLALRDLDESVLWLDREDEVGPAARLIANLTLSLATARLEVVRRALETYGTDTALKG